MLPTCCGLASHTAINYLDKLTCQDVANKSATSPQKVFLMEFGKRHNRLTTGKSPTCHGLTMGNWCNGFWPLTNCGRCVCCRCAGPCAEPMCLYRCPYGRKKDQDGCWTCACKERPKLIAVRGCMHKPTSRSKVCGNPGTSIAECASRRNCCWDGRIKRCFVIGLPS